MCVARASSAGHSGFGDRWSNFSVASSIIVSRYVKVVSGSCFGSFRRFHVSGRLARSIDLIPFRFSGVSVSIMFAVEIIPRM